MAWSHIRPYCLALDSPQTFCESLLRPGDPFSQCSHDLDKRFPFYTSAALHLNKQNSPIAHRVAH